VSPNGTMLTSSLVLLVVVGVVGMVVWGGGWWLVVVGGWQLVVGITVAPDRPRAYVAPSLG